MTTFITSCFVIFILNIILLLSTNIKISNLFLDKEIWWHYVEVMLYKTRLYEMQVITNMTAIFLTTNYLFYLPASLFSSTFYGLSKILFILYMQFCSYSFIFLINRPISHLLSTHGTRRWEKSIFIGRKKAEEECNIKLFDDHRSDGFITRWWFICWKA